MSPGIAISSIVLVFLIVCVLFESLVIAGFKITRFPRSLVQALLANGVSVVVIYFIWPLISRMDIDEDKVFPLLPILFGTTIVVEALLLKALNRVQPWLRIFLTSAVMNILSFAALYGILLLL